MVQIQAPIDVRQEHSTIELPRVGSAAPIRLIAISVDVPQVQVVHTARLHILGPSRRPGPIAVGDALPAQLTIRHSRRWSSQLSPEAKVRGIDFWYELEAHPDTWIMGGQRRAVFRAKVRRIARVGMVAVD
jgi:hypothetical protein